FACELETIFKQSACYIGNEKAVPEPGDWRRLAQEDGGRLLVRNAGGVELMSNVCRHRQAIMINGRGTASNIVCPLHRWTYDLKGELLGAPHFAQQPCLHL
ncbi:Rieske 2Fe-2S domain-containing protein, partial [Acinetobacter baumannii]